MLVPTAWLQNSGSNWPGLRGHSQLRRCRTPRALPTGAYPLASLVLHCPPLDVHGANFMVLPAPAVGTKRRKQCAPRTPPLIRIRAVWLGEHVLHRFVKSQPKHYPGDPMGPAGPLACLSPPSFFTRRKMVPPEGVSGQTPYKKNLKVEELSVKICLLYTSPSPRD